MRFPARTAVIAACGAVAAALTADAAGGETAADARLNGQQIGPSVPLVLRPGDRLETGSAAANIRTAGGGQLRVAPFSLVRHAGTERGVESFFAVRGTVEGDVGDATILGAAAAWATTHSGASGRVRVVVLEGGAMGPRTKDAATFESAAGHVWLRFHAVSAGLPEGCGATLVPSEDGPGSMSCSASASNREPVELTRATGERVHAAGLPPGAAVVLTDRAGGTRFECREATAGSVVRVEAREGTRVVRKASLGAGAGALLAGDAVTLDIPALPEGVLADLLALDREFATLDGR